jgi:hypothetical protein
MLMNIFNAEHSQITVYILKKLSILDYEDRLPMSLKRRYYVY